MSATQLQLQPATDGPVEPALASAMGWIHVEGPEFAPKLIRYVASLERLLEAIEGGDADEIRAADVALTADQLDRWVPNGLTSGVVREALELHRSSGCRQCWPSATDQPTGGSDA